MGRINDHMKKSVYILNDNIITSLGFTTAENTAAIRQNTSGIRTITDPVLYPVPVPVSQVDTAVLDSEFAMLLQHYKKNVPAGSYTRLEKMFILSIYAALDGYAELPANPKTLLVISTTKGNVNLLEGRYKNQFNHKRVYLWEFGRIVRQFFGFRNPPLIVSNACISGVVAVMAASRFLQSGQYDHAVVAGGDIASEFVISGFQSFQALSPAPCKPFDLHRTGLSLGEGCGSMILSVSPASATKPSIRITGAATSNDANHISGPSRTGAELSHAINLSMNQAALNPGDIHYISAHGTATPYNDEMESKAIDLSRLTHVPVNSFKGYWGHTLGAAGIIESVAAITSMKDNFLYRSAGFDTPGVPVPLNVITSHHQAAISTCLKTASGFGGCNAAIIYQKD
jgi:3-oxoacyl-[acyl-carrier-protein] synthase-1